MNLWTIPSPDQGVWELGPVPVRAYALCIIAGVVAAIWIGERRWVARGGAPGQISDLAIWGVPFGLVGARLYHVATDWQLYFGEGQDPLSALYIWRGGLGVWGGITLGAVGVMIGARRMGLRLWPVLDAMAPGVALAQALGRWGNWFNQELFGRPTELPWALEIDPANRPAGYLDEDTFHPTFLYESLWNLGLFGLLLWADARFRLGWGRVAALYVAGYTAGRLWIEHLRIDDVQLDDVLGLRWNEWMSIALFLLAVAWFVVSRRRHPDREESVHRDGAPQAAPSDEAPSDEAPSDEAPSDESPSDEAPSDEAPSDEARADQAPADGSTGQGPAEGGSDPVR